MQKGPVSTRRTGPFQESSGGTNGCQVQTMKLPGGGIMPEAQCTGNSGEAPSQTPLSLSGPMPIEQTDLAD